jgi:hypothetical protein
MCVYSYIPFSLLNGSIQFTLSYALLISLCILWTTPQQEGDTTVLSLHCVEAFFTQPSSPLVDA